MSSSTRVPARPISGTFTLRRALPADAEAVRTLVRQAYAKWVPVIGREPKPMTANYATAVRLNRIDLACAGDEKGAELAGLIETIDRSDHLLIENVAVAPSFQGRRLGRTLMAHAERVAAAQSYRAIRLYTNKAFAENVALYLRLGYHIDREEESALGVTVYMSKSVA